MALDVAQTGLGTAKPKSRKGYMFLVCFGLLWSVLTIGADWMAISGLLRQADASRRFLSTPGTVLSATIEESTGDDGTSYSPKLDYAYSVASRNYRSDRYWFGVKPGSHSFASGVVNAHPPGSTATVYYDPAHPEVSVLKKQVHAPHVFILLFLAPFNAVLMGGAAFALRTVQRRPEPPAGGTLFSDDGRTAILRPQDSSPFLVGCMFFGLSGFVLALASIFVSPISSSISGAAWSLFIAVSIGVGTAHSTAQRLKRGHYDLVLDRSLRRLKLPAAPALLAGTAELPFDRVERVEVESETVTDSDGSTIKYHVRLYATATINSPLALATRSDAAQAESLASWLREALGTPASPVGLRRSA